jgi:hypothetical protein
MSKPSVGNHAALSKRFVPDDITDGAAFVKERV